MLRLKQTTSVFLALISNVVLAGSMGPTCNSEDVTVPCVNTGWDFGVQALYLRPSYSGSMGWVGVNTTFGGQFLPTTRIENTPEWAWGFKLEGSYHFNTGNDLNLNWYHLGERTAQMISRETALSRLEGEHLTTVKPSWDAINLELGQRVNFGEIKNIRIHGGLQVANIRTHIGITGPDQLTDPVVPFTYAGEANAKFTGIGPRLGTDMSYSIFSGFDFYAKGAVAVLVGKGKLSQTYTNSINDLSFNYALKTTNATITVPELEAKLGINYNYLVTNGSLTLDAGYLWVNYFNVLFAARNTRSVDNSFSVNGPYVGVKWLGINV